MGLMQKFSKATPDFSSLQIFSTSEISEATSCLRILLLLFQQVIYLQKKSELGTFSNMKEKSLCRPNQQSLKLMEKAPIDLRGS